MATKPKPSKLLPKLSPARDEIDSKPTVTRGAIHARRQLMKFFDRLLTIVITATLTSAVWIVFGTTLISMAEGESAQESGEIPELVDPPAPTPITPPELGQTPSPPITPAAPPIAEPSDSPDEAPIVAPTTDVEPEAAGPVVEGDASEKETDGLIEA